MTDVIGWLSSVVLLATIVLQIAKQWSERSGEGVSPWLFIGQTVASVGFTAYSALAKNWVFTVTNGLMLVSAILGWGITAHFRRQSAGPATTAVPQRHAHASVSPRPVP
jgi:MtN3 and saliva related transmembrane protein